MKKENLAVSLLFALLATSCAESINYSSNPAIYFPDLPANVKTAGTYVKLPEQDITTQSDYEKLLSKLARSDRDNARAVKSCINYHRKLQTIYNKKQPSTSVSGGIKLF